MLKNTHKVILLVIGIFVLIAGIVLFFIPPALFPDPANGFQVLRCMKLGAPFNTFISPDQSDISDNYTEFLTWWSPGQYLVPYFFMLMTGINTGKAIAVTVTLCGLSGLAGLYCFFKKIGFSSLIVALSLLFIVCQQAFVVPYVYYNGGEILLFAFEGWFLYGCAAFEKTNFKLIIFVLLSGWLGFFLKSSFIWIYIAGLFCLWIRLSEFKASIAGWLYKALWIGIPASVSLLVIFITFLSKGQSPASASHALKLTAETFTFPVASPVLSAFSIDDLLHGLLFHTGSAVIDPAWDLPVLFLAAIISIALIYAIIRFVQNFNYRLFLVVFYVVSILFLGTAFLRQLTISYEARHFRVIGFLAVPGMIYLITRRKIAYKAVYVLIIGAIAFTSFSYLIKGFEINRLSARGITGIAQPNIDQASLNQVIKLDRENTNAVFVFIGNDLGLEVLHNRIISLQPVSDDLKTDINDYKYDGFAGPLFIILPESYRGPKEKLVIRSFPGYTGFHVASLSAGYMLYEASLKRQ